jgi:hypothetical protein
LIDDRKPLLTTASEAESPDILACTAEFDALYDRCAKALPEFGLSPVDFRGAVRTAVEKYLIGFGEKRDRLSVREIRLFIGQLQEFDLYLALACASGSENAWWAL